MIYALGGVSGAHFNPAVTVALTLAGKSPAGDIPHYMAAQLLGGAMVPDVRFVSKVLCCQRRLFATCLSWKLIVMNDNDNENDNGDINNVINVNNKHEK